MQNLKEFFLLRDDVTYLNFGAYGACLKSVFEQYQQYQLELEREPVRFIANNGLKYLEASREALGNYIHCDKDDVVYVTNPSYAVNAVAKSFDLKAGDEILSTDLEYGACSRTWDYYCSKAGATFVKQHITLPVQSKEQVVEEFFKGLSDRTRMIFLSHITSTTAMRLPVEEICVIAKAKGIMTFVDGAHACGQIPIDLVNSSFDFYTGACHKWMMTPKGSSFLYVKKEYQDRVDPLVFSWGYKALFPSSSTFIDYHQTNGTRDYSAFLTIPTAIQFMKDHEWEKVAAGCRQLVQSNAATFCELLDTVPLAPVNDNFILQLFSAEINTPEPEALHQHFFNKYKIEIPVNRHGGKVYLRYSINAFNSQDDLDKLFVAIKEIKRETKLIQ